MPTLAAPILAREACLQQVRGRMPHSSAGLCNLGSLNISAFAITNYIETELDECIALLLPTETQLPLARYPAITELWSFEVRVFGMGLL